MTEPGLLLIRGLGHSGSTLLDLVLGGHPSVIGLGEASRVLLSALADSSVGCQLNDWREQYTQPCTCGLMIDQCRSNSAGIACGPGPQAIPPGQAPLR